MAVGFSQRQSIFEPPSTLDPSRPFWQPLFFRIYKMTAECEKTQQKIILRNIELNLQTKFIEQLKHMIGTDFNSGICQIDFWHRLYRISYA